MSSQTRRTLSQLRTAVRQRVPVSENDTQVTYDVIDGFINSALRQVSVEDDWPWLLATATITTVAGTDTYAVPADWLGTKTIYDTSNTTVLRPRHLEELLEYPTTTTGPPSLFVIEKELILLRPVPDAVYTLTHYYFKAEPALAGDTSTPLVPQGQDEGVVEYAAYLVLRFKREDTRADESMKAYVGWLKRTADNVSEIRSPRPPRVRPGSLL